MESLRNMKVEVPMGCGDDVQVETGTCGTGAARVHTGELQA
jgi:hypothetical protein